MCGRLTAIGVSCLVLAWAMPVAAQSSDAGRFWGQWRGPDATGVARYGNPPTEWSETKNLRWKMEIPGRGSASPIVWGDKIFLLTAVPLGDPVPQAAAADADQPPSVGLSRGGRDGRRRGHGRVVRAIRMHRFVVMAIDRESGDVVWERVAREAVPHEGHQEPNGTYASGSAVTDGEHLFAFFGSWGLYAYDMDGNLKWGGRSRHAFHAERLR